MGAWILFDIIASVFIDKLIAVVCGILMLIFAIIYGAYRLFKGNDDEEDEFYDSYEEY